MHRKKTDGSEPSDITTSCYGTNGFVTDKSVTAVLKETPSSANTVSFYKDGVAIQKNVPVVGTVEKTFTDSGKYKVEISAVEKFLDGDNTGKAEYEFTIDRGQEGAGSMPEEGSIGGMPE